MVSKIAVAHPGKHGDALYTLPVIRALCAKHDCKADFYTSSYCEPLRDLFMAQTDCINGFYVAPNYVIERMDCGVQPPYIPVDASLYDAVYQLGFHEVPNAALPEYMARQVGVRPFPIRYELPQPLEYPPNFPQGPYLTLALRASDDYTRLFQRLIDHASMPCVIVGGNGDAGQLKGGYDATGLPYLLTALIIALSKGFVGLMSSQLVLANGFDIPKVVPHDGHSWDMRHVVRGRFNHYPIKPSADEVLELLKGENNVAVYSKTADEADYAASDTYQHIKNMQSMLDGAHNGWLTEYRRWEYGVVLQALRENGAQTVLDVGGGSSIFAASAIWCGMDVKVVDPDDYAAMFEEQSRRIGKTVPFIHQDFFDFQSDDQYDAVVSISTIEHVPEDLSFFKKLLTLVKPGGLVALTTDFHPSGSVMTGGHLRTYNAERLTDFIQYARNAGFEVYGGAADYSRFEPNVLGVYSFASLVMKRAAE